MSRTPDEIAQADLEARRVGYLPPPPQLEPRTHIHQGGRQWESLVDWFEQNTKDFDSAMLVYLSHRYDWPLSGAYIATDSFIKAQYRRFEERDHPDDNFAYGN